MSRSAAAGLSVRLSCWLCFPLALPDSVLRGGGAGAAHSGEPGVCMGVGEGPTAGLVGVHVSVGAAAARVSGGSC